MDNMISLMKMNAHIAAKSLRGEYMVELYTLPTCGICHTIKTKLEQKGIQFEEKDFGIRQRAHEGAGIRS